MTKLVEIMDPKVDSIFKKIFGENDKIFIDFVNSVFADKNEKLVKSVTFLNTELTKDRIDGKDCVLDVRAVLDDESQTNIEVQVAPQNFYVKRSLFYWAKLYTGQISTGKSYKELKRSISINILNFDLFPKNTKYHTVLAGLDLDSHEWIAPEFEVHYLEIPKMPKKAYNKKTMTRLEKWLKFFQEPNKQVLEELAMEDKIFESAKDTLFFLSQKPEERAEYEQRLKYLLDKNTEMEEAEAKGETKGRIEVAKNLKNMGLPFEKIMQATLLSKEEIEKL